jgi:hypothetical protein
MEEAKHIISQPVLFNVAEMRNKLLVCPEDILLVQADEIDSRNKITWIKNELRAYTLMDVSFSEIQDSAKDTIMVNRHMLIAIQAIHGCAYDVITLKDLFTGWNSKQVTLSRKYNAGFYARLGSKGK